VQKAYLFRIWAMSIAEENMYRPSNYVLELLEKERKKNVCILLLCKLKCAYKRNDKTNKQAVIYRWPPLLPIICNLLTCVTWRHVKTLSYIIHVQPCNTAPEKLLGCLASSFTTKIREKLSLIRHVVKQNLLWRVNIVTKDTIRVFGRTSIISRNP